MVWGLCLKLFFRVSVVSGVAFRIIYSFFLFLCCFMDVFGLFFCFSVVSGVGFRVAFR